MERGPQRHCRSSQDGPKNFQLLVNTTAKLTIALWVLADLLEQVLVSGQVGITEVELHLQTHTGSQHYQSDHSELVLT